MFRKEALEEIKGQRSQIGKYGSWKNYIDKAMDEAKYFSDSNGTIPLEVIDDIKKSMYGISNFLDPDDSAIKAIARAGKNIIEKNTRSADIKALNRELSRWYNTRDYLKSIGVGKVIR